MSCLTYDELRSRWLVVILSGGVVSAAVNHDHLHPFCSRRGGRRNPRHQARPRLWSWLIGSLIFGKVTPANVASSWRRPPPIRPCIVSTKQKKSPACYSFGGGFCFLERESFAYCGGLKYSSALLVTPSGSGNAASANNSCISVSENSECSSVWLSTFSVTLQPPFRIPNQSSLSVYAFFKKNTNGLTAWGCTCHLWVKFAAPVNKRIWPRPPKENKSRKEYKTSMS